ncbi:MAG: hypothetical protein AAF658_13665 [Myxococcota bacterium]
MSTNRLPILDERTLHDTQELPTVHALESLWSEISARPLWAPPSFFRYLKLRWSTRLRLLNADAVPVFAPRGQINDCTGCTEMCCIGPRSTVLLRFRDIATLMDIGREDLMVHEKPEFSREELVRNPALRLQLASSDWRRFPVLAKNEFSACRALTTDGACGLYPHWPMACARFPYTLDVDAKEITYSKRCRSFWIRDDGTSRARAMAVAAVAAYNERIKDRILMAYAPERLEELGLLKFLL